MHTTSKARLVGGGIGSLAAAFMIRDDVMADDNMTVLNTGPVPGGSLDGAEICQ